MYGGNWEPEQQNVDMSTTKVGNPYAQSANTSTNPIWSGIENWLPLKSQIKWVEVKFEHPYELFKTVWSLNDQVNCLCRWRVLYISLVHPDFILLKYETRKNIIYNWSFLRGCKLWNMFAYLWIDPEYYSELFGDAAAFSNLWKRLQEIVGKRTIL